MKLKLEQLAQISGGNGTPGIQVSKTKSGKWRVSYTNSSGIITVNLKFATEWEATRCRIFLIKQYSELEYGSESLERFMYSQK